MQTPTLCTADCGEDTFDNLLRCIEGRGIVGLLEAYFDESERQGGIFCVAGYAFIPRQTRTFIKAWKPLFAPFGGFHMKDLVHRRKGFEGISCDQRDNLLREAVRIINTTMQFGFAVSCPMDEIMLHSQSVHAFRHAYPICCYLAMIELVHMMIEARVEREVFYTFESGHPCEGEAREFIKAIASNPAAKRDLRHAGDAFLPKNAAVPLQAADLLAWEWAKCKDETIDRRLRPIRNSLLALFRRDTKRYKVAHVHGEKLAKYLAVMPGILRQEGIIDARGRTIQ